MPKPQYLIIWQAGKRVHGVAEPGNHGLLNRWFGDSSHHIEKVAPPLRRGSRNEPEGAGSKVTDIAQDRSKQSDRDDDAGRQAHQDCAGVQRWPEDTEDHYRQDQSGANDQLPDGHGTRCGVRAGVEPQLLEPAWGYAIFCRRPAEPRADSLENKGYTYDCCNECQHTHEAQPDDLSDSAGLAGELPFHVSGQHDRTGDEGEGEQARDPAKCKQSEQWQRPALTAHDRDRHSEDGSGGGPGPEELCETVFVSFLITRASLGQPADDIGETGEASTYLGAAFLVGGCVSFAFVSTQAARCQHMATATQLCCGGERRSNGTRRCTADIAKAEVGSQLADGEWIDHARCGATLHSEIEAGFHVRGNGVAGDRRPSGQPFGRRTGDGEPGGRILAAECVTCLVAISADQRRGIHPDRIV